MSAFGQSRTVYRTAADIRQGSAGSISGTVVDVDEARRQLQLEPDENPAQRVTVMSDSVSTVYYGFGGIINDAPEIFKGSSGFANVRVGDRLDVRGTGRANFVLMAEQMTLLGRAVEASQVGIGTTRGPTSVSTPTATQTTRSTGSAGFAEGTIRQINPNAGRMVIQTAQRRMITVRATRTTPVYYRGEIYRIDNLEVGDRIRVEANERDAAAGDISARVIDVVQSVQESSALPNDRRVTSLAGRVTRVERAADTIGVDTGRGEVRVDMSRAADATGRGIRASDLRVGDQVDISGSYDGSGSEIFLASTVRFGTGDVFTDRTDSTVTVDEGYERGDYAVFSLSGTVTESLQTSPVLVIRDRASGRNVEIFVTDDFVYRTKTGGYATADRLAVGEAVLIKAFRDEDNNLIAQTIRMRP
ncbi:MAG TPA: DUF5666 domain-containing protein [Thermoanaerobaculia bacterium]|nr:DUF5666 domain-containing protein [Thermoanaerobaculia bacterium]